MSNIVKSDMQMMPIEQAQNWYNDFVAFSKSIMKKDLDYGEIPGTGKPSLYKAGAEKLRFVYGLGTEMECVEKTVDIDRPFIRYVYRCTVSTKQGQVLAQCEGSCNSLEAKYGWVWKTEAELPAGADTSNLVSRVAGKKAFEFDFALQKRETAGQYGKPSAYWDQWDRDIESGRAKRITKETKGGKKLSGYEVNEQVVQYRVPNPDAIGMDNTIMKMAQKRAFVGAILLATGASEFYTQDIEDMEISGQVYSDAKPVVEDAEVVEEKKTEIPGLWYARLDKCKTPSDIDELGKKHAATINANPALRKLFVERKAALKKGTGSQEYNETLPF